MASQPALATNDNDSSAEGPVGVIWDITYACPLRCSHCYSESGRRPSRQLASDDLFHVADRLVAFKPDLVALAGGEPLLVKGVFDVALRLAEAGIPVHLYTSGWPLTPSMVEDIVRLFSEVHVSVDGATSDVHDRIRGRHGSFERAMNALSLLDEAANTRGVTRHNSMRFGIDYVVLRSNLHQLEQLCSDMASRFSNISFISFGAVVPSGLASREEFGDREFLGGEQLRALVSDGFVTRLRSLVPRSVHVTTTDNLELQMHPRAVTSGASPRLMQVEPDGAVRAMPIYEGTVGNLRQQPAVDLWKRAVSRWSDPYVTDALSSVRTMTEWGEATRKIDRHFGSEEVRLRISRRPKYLAPDGSDHPLP